MRWILSAFADHFHFSQNTDLQYDLVILTAQHDLRVQAKLPHKQIVVEIGSLLAGKQSLISATNDQIAYPLHWVAGVKGGKKVDDRGVVAPERPAADQGDRRGRGLAGANPPYPALRTNF